MTGTLTKAQTEWYDWRERVADATSPLLSWAVEMEQTMLRSMKETRCAECGATGEIKHQGGYLSHLSYLLCGNCDAHFEGSVGGNTYTVLGRHTGEIWDKIESLNNRRKAERIARAFDGETVVRRNG